LLALWLQTQPNLDESVPVYARTPVITQAPADISPLLETVPATAPQVTPASAVSEAAPATNASDVPAPAISQPAPEPTPVVVSQASLTNVQPPSLAPKENARPDFRLNGIIYTVARPFAIVNGKTVYVGDQVSGATVISIRPTDVTLQVNGVRRTYNLR
jgi:hypothetical protein